MRKRRSSTRQSDQQYIQEMMEQILKEKERGNHARAERLADELVHFVNL